jgi:hypothetical protein
MKQQTRKYLKKLINNKTRSNTKKQSRNTNQKSKCRKTIKGSRKSGRKNKTVKSKTQSGSGFLRSAQCAGINLKLRLETKITCKLRHQIKKHFNNEQKKIEEITHIIDRYIRKGQILIRQGVNLSVIKLYKGEEIKITKKAGRDQLIEALSKIPKNNTFYNIQLILSQYCDVKGTTGYSKFVLAKIVTNAIFS